MATAAHEAEKSRVQAFWEADPCGAAHGEAPEGTPEFFAQIERSAKAGDFAEAKRTFDGGASLISASLEALKQA